MYVPMGWGALTEFVCGESMKDIVFFVLSCIRTCLDGLTLGRVGTVFVRDSA